MQNYSIRTHHHEFEKKYGREKLTNLRIKLTENLSGFSRTSSPEEIEKQIQEIQEELGLVLDQPTLLGLRSEVQEEVVFHLGINRPTVLLALVSEEK